MITNKNKSSLLTVATGIVMGYLTDPNKKLTVSEFKTCIINDMKNKGYTVSEKLWPSIIGSTLKVLPNSTQFNGFRKCMITNPELKNYFHSNCGNVSVSGMKVNLMEVAIKQAYHNGLVVTGAYKNKFKNQSEMVAYLDKKVSTFQLPETSVHPTNIVSYLAGRTFKTTQSMKRDRIVNECSTILKTNVPFRTIQNNITNYGIVAKSWGVNIPSRKHTVKGY